MGEQSGQTDRKVRRMVRTNGGVWQTARRANGVVFDLCWPWDGCSDIYEEWSGVQLGVKCLAQGHFNYQGWEANRWPYQQTILWTPYLKRQKAWSMVSISIVVSIPVWKHIYNEMSCCFLHNVQFQKQISNERFQTSTIVTKNHLHRIFWQKVDHNIFMKHNSRFSYTCNVVNSTR